MCYKVFFSPEVGGVEKMIQHKGQVSRWWQTLPS